MSALSISKVVWTWNDCEVQIVLGYIKARAGQMQIRKMCIVVALDKCSVRMTLQNERHYLQTIRSDHPIYIP